MVGFEIWKINRKSWLDKERNVDISDIKGDVMTTLVELGIEEKSFVNDNTKYCYPEDQDLLL